MPVELPALFYAIPRNPAIAVGLPLAFGMASGFITKNSVNTWYPTLKKPAVSHLVINTSELDECVTDELDLRNQGEPPRWAFPAAWTFLYCSMGLASHLIIKNFDGALPGSAPNVTADIALKLYWGQFGLNMLWTPLFFGLHKLGLALADISLLTPTTYALTYQAYKVDPRTAFALVPYCAWLSYATYLNGESFS
ncbi:SPOSA6832_01701, partial [Sporobolomyces salmonicolor]